MQMKFDIPDWEDAKKRCENMDGSPIDAFVSYNEPGDESAFMFREQLRDLIDYIVLCCTDPARNLTTHEADEQPCPLHDQKIGHEIAGGLWGVCTCENDGQD